jgi:hypothetical protein
MTWLPMPFLWEAGLRDVYNPGFRETIDQRPYYLGNRPAPERPHGPSDCHLPHVLELTP